MEQEYPLMMDGVRRGVLTERRDGLFTEFEATLYEGEGLVRLAVYGGGREGYLGVMQPFGGGMYLRRRMTRREREALPAAIEYAAPTGERLAEAENAPKCEAADACATIDDEEPEGDEGLIWYARPDGSLTAFDGQGSIVALPADLRREAEGAVLREINGGGYMLFRY